MTRQLNSIILTCFLNLLVASTRCDLIEPCPTFWTAYKDHCYRFFVKARTWVEAESQCRLFGAPNGAGVAHLVTIHSAQEEEFIFDFHDTIIEGAETVWIGFNDIEHEGKFEWVDGEDAVYTNWKESEPNNLNDEDCAALYYGEKKWNDYECDKSTLKLPYFCKMRRVRHSSLV